MGYMQDWPEAAPDAKQSNAQGGSHLDALRLCCAGVRFLLHGSWRTGWCEAQSVPAHGVLNGQRLCLL